MAIEQLQLIDTIVQQTKQLLQLAESEQWQDLADLEQQRQSQLQNLTLEKLQLPASQHKDVELKLTMLIDLNHKLETMCREQRQDIVTELKQFDHASKAVKAYTK